MLRLRTLLFLAVAVLMSTAASADATFRMRIESGTTTGPGVVLTADGSFGFAPGIPPSTYSTLTDQFITFSGPITTQFAINSTTGTSTPLLASPGFYEAMDLNNFTINASGAGTIRIILERDGFGAATPDTPVSLRSLVGGTLVGPAGSTVTFDTYADDDNLMPSLGVDVFPTGALVAVAGIGVGAEATVNQSFGVGAFSGDNTVDFTKTGTYSMYTVVTVTFTGAGNVSFDQHFGTAPAPAGLVLLATAAPALALGAWLRRRKASAPTA